MRSRFMASWRIQDIVIPPIQQVFQTTKVARLHCTTRFALRKTPGNITCPDVRCLTQSQFVTLAKWQQEEPFACSQPGIPEILQIISQASYVLIGMLFGSVRAVAWLQWYFGPFICHACFFFGGQLLRQSGSFLGSKCL
jgi:hypothetical protein